MATVTVDLTNDEISMLALYIEGVIQNLEEELTDPAGVSNSNSQFLREEIEAFREQLDKLRFPGRRAVERSTEEGGPALGGRRKTYRKKNLE